MELITEYLFQIYTKADSLPFPDYLNPLNKMRNDFWVTKEYKVIYPWDMDDRHLINTINLLHRSHQNLEKTYNKSDSDEFILFGLSPLKSSKKRRKTYAYLWEEYRIYMLLRRELKLRALEKKYF